MIRIATDNLGGSLSQLINRCKDRISSWITAALASYLPLSGGTMSEGANIKTTGTISASRVVIDNNSYIDNGVEILKSDNTYIHMLDTTITSGATPENSATSGVFFNTGDNKAISHVEFAANKVADSDDVRTMIYMCTHDFFNPESYTSIGIYHDASQGFYTSSPHPTKLDTNGNAVINTADNSNKIATTKWVNSAIADMRVDSTKQLATTNWVNNKISEAINTTISNISADNGLVFSKTGEINKPIYINSSGIPTACGFEVNKTVPADAKFTDTVYTHPIATAKTSDTDCQPTANLVPAWGQSVTISQITYNAEGHITKTTNRTIKIPDSVASTTDKGLMSKDDKILLNTIKNNYASQSYVGNLVNNPAGGLVIEDGKLKVDFSKMPDTSEEDRAAQEAFKKSLLSSLNMKIPLKKSMVMYVNPTHANAGDNQIDVDNHFRGDSTYPYSTIQGCINYITQTYSFGPYYIRIEVYPGTYNGSITLPNFDRTTGYITIYAYNYANPPIIQNNGITGGCMYVTGGKYYLVRLKMEGTYSIPANSTSNIYTNVFSMEVGTVYMYGCEISCVYNAGEPAHSKYYRIMPISVWNDGLLNICSWGEVGRSDSVGNKVSDAFYQNKFNCVKNNAIRAEIFHLENSGTIFLPSHSSFVPEGLGEVDISGSVDCVISASGNCAFKALTGGTHIQRMTGEVIGRRYGLGETSVLRTRREVSGETTPKESVPGTIDGTIDSSTFCWARTV